jgi:hypothetical protein
MELWVLLLAFSAIEVTAAYVVPLPTSPLSALRSGRPRGGGPAGGGRRAAPAVGRRDLDSGESEK